MLLFIGCYYFKDYSINATLSSANIHVLPSLFYLTINVYSFIILSVPTNTFKVVHVNRFVGTPLGDTDIW